MPFFFVLHLPSSLACPLAAPHYGNWHPVFLFPSFILPARNLSRQSFVIFSHLYLSLFLFQVGLSSFLVSSFLPWWVVRVQEANGHREGMDSGRVRLKNPRNPRRGHIRLETSKPDAYQSVLGWMTCLGFESSIVSWGSSSWNSPTLMLK